MNILEEGFMPILVDREGDSVVEPPTREHLTNMHKPVYAQHAAFLDAQGVEIPEKVIDTAERFLCAYEAFFRHEETGLFFWQDDCAIGVDNDPCTFFRPPRSCGSLFLNSLLYREMLALAALFEKRENNKKAFGWRNKAAALKKAIVKECFDERDGCFYSVDLNLLPNQNVTGLHSGAPRDWGCLLMRFDVWSNILPLWAGIADQYHADRTIRRFREERTYRAKYGIRTLSAQEKMYDLSATNNPSNWRGPVWGVSNYLCWRAMVKYGYEEDAAWLAEQTVRLFGQDIAHSGTLHEYYHPDTGEPIMTPGFMNWNALVLIMMAWLNQEPYCTEF